MSNMDWTDCPEAAGPIAESDFGTGQYGQPGYPSIGQVPHLMPPEMRDANRAYIERRGLLIQEIELAALAATRDVLAGRALADTAVTAARKAAKA